MQPTLPTIARRPGRLTLAWYVCWGLYLAARHRWLVSKQALLFLIAERMCLCKLQLQVGSLGGRCLFNEARRLAAREWLLPDEHVELLALACRLTAPGSGLTLAAVVRQLRRHASLKGALRMSPELPAFL